MKPLQKKAHPTKKKLYWITVPVLVIAVLAVLLLFRCLTAPKTALQINGLELPLDQYQEELSAAVPEVYRHFEQQYGISVQDEPGFWNSTYGGENPVEYAHQVVIDKWRRYQVILQEAKDNGLIEDISWDGLQALWQQENQTRKEKLEAGEIVYGPQSFSWDGFLDVTIMGFFDDLTQIYATSQFRLADDAMRQIYEKEKDEKYTYDDTITINIIRIPYNLDNMEEKSRIVFEIQKFIQEGGTMEQAASQYGIPLESTQFLAENAYEDNRKDGVIRSVALELSPGQISDVIHDSSRRCFAIAACTQRIPQGYIPLEDVKEDIQRAYSQECLTLRIETLIQQAQVEILEKNLLSLHP